MSEVDKHYGATLPGRRGPASPLATEGELDDPVRQADLRGKARDAIADAREAASSVRDQVGSAYGVASDWASDTLDTASRNATYARRRTAAELNRGRRQVETFVGENPIMIGLAGLAAGLLIGSLLPGTRREDRILGPYADEARREGLRYAQSMAEQGKQIVEENLRGLREGLDRETGPSTGS